LSRSSNELRSLASQTALYGLSTVVGRLLNYLLVPLHTRLFEPQEYGVITDFYAMAALLAVIYTYGMETAFFSLCESQGSKCESRLRHFLLCRSSDLSHSKCFVMDEC